MAPRPRPGRLRVTQFARGQGGVGGQVRRRPAGLVDHRAADRAKWPEFLQLTMSAYLPDPIGPIQELNPPARLDPKNQIKCRREAPRPHRRRSSRSTGPTWPPSGSTTRAILEPAFKSYMHPLDREHPAERRGLGGPDRRPPLQPEPLPMDEPAEREERAPDPVSQFGPVGYLDMEDPARPPDRGCGSARRGSTTSPWPGWRLGQEVDDRAVGRQEQRPGLSACRSCPGLKPPGEAAAGGAGRCGGSMGGPAGHRWPASMPAAGRCSGSAGASGGGYR